MCTTRKPEEGIESPEARDTHNCQLPWGHWESKLGPPYEQTVLSAADPLLQLLGIFLSGAVSSDYFDSIFKNQHHFQFVSCPHRHWKPWPKCAVPHGY